MGRPPKYTQERADKVLHGIRLGATYEHAAAYAGISPDTLARWRASNAAFADRITLAEGAAVIGWLARIEKAADDGDWRAAAHKLERRYPHDYGKTVNEQQLTGKDGEGLAFTIKIDRSDAPAPE